MHVFTDKRLVTGRDCTLDLHIALGTFEEKLALLSGFHASRSK